jgi:hypothetical protein
LRPLSERRALPLTRSQVLAISPRKERGEVKNTASDDAPYSAVQPPSIE